MTKTDCSYGISGIRFDMVKIGGSYGISGEGRITFGVGVARTDSCCRISSVGFDMVKGGDSCRSSGTMGEESKVPGGEDENKNGCYGIVTIWISDGGNSEKLQFDFRMDVIFTWKNCVVFFTS